jgi:hypothetical protein
VTGAELLDLAMNAGFSPGDAAIASAVALAESNGNANAYNPETAAGNAPGKGSVGLWQINLAAHPEFSGWNLYDPQTNANAAFQVWQGAGGSFQPWTTFRTGAYQAFLTGGLGPAGPSSSPLVVSPTTQDVPPAASSPGFTAGGILMLAGAGLGLYFLADVLAD